MRRLTILAAGLAVFFVGCSVVFDPSAHMTGGAMDGGSDAASPDAGPPTVALADFCPMVAQVYCVNAALCCTLPATFDSARCLSETESNCASVYGLTATRSEIDYDPAQAYEAIAEGTALVEMCSLEVQSFMIRRDGLLRGIVGTVGGGEECTPAGSGDANLTVAVLSCTGGQVCQRRSDTYWNCQVPAPDGAPCRYGFDCANGRCQQANAFAARLCGPGESAGSGCNPFQPDECMSLACAWDSTPPRGFECTELTQNSAYCTYASPAAGG